jgi:membrane-anchored mycosin MYCP
MLDPERVWPLTTGAGRGRDRRRGGGSGPPAVRRWAGAGGDRSGVEAATPDCDGRGTFAAGIVAAKADPGTTFAGLAPGVAILPVRVTDGADDAGPDPDRLAAGPQAAIDAGATILCVITPADRDSPALRIAVTRARDAGRILTAPAASGDRPRPPSRSALVSSPSAASTRTVYRSHSRPTTPPP